MPNIRRIWHSRLCQTLNDAPVRRPIWCRLIPIVRTIELISDPQVYRPICSRDRFTKSVDLLVLLSFCGQAQLVGIEIERDL